MTSATVPEITATDHVRGAAAPSVTLIEYGDYDCPHTRKAQASIDQLLAATPGLRVVYRHFPLRDLHDRADKLARLAQAAEAQEKFWALHDRFMRHRVPVDDDILRADAAAAGVDLAALERAAKDAAVIAHIEADLVGGRKAGVHSTPSFFFNGVLHDGHYDLDTLSARLHEAERGAGK